MFVIEIVHRHDPPSRHYVYESLYNARAGFLSRIGVTISFYSQTRHKQETCRAEDTEQANAMNRGANAIVASSKFDVVDVINGSRKCCALVVRAFSLVLFLTAHAQ